MKSVRGFFNVCGAEPPRSSAKAVPAAGLSCPASNVLHGLDGYRPNRCQMVELGPAWFMVYEVQPRCAAGEQAVAQVRHHIQPEGAQRR